MLFLSIHVGLHTTIIIDSEILSVLTHVVRKAPSIRNRYNHVTHLTKDTIWESSKNTINHHKHEPRGQPFPAGGHKAAIQDIHKT